MELKLTKIFLLLFCLLGFSLNYDDAQFLEPNVDLVFHAKTEKDYTYKVGLLQEVSNYLDYTIIEFIPDPYENITQNPFVIVASDDECLNQRMSLGTQLYGTIYLFLKTEQIQNRQFFICVKGRDGKQNEITFSINVKTNNKAMLPFDAQTSYYISDEKNKDMEFLFQPELDAKEITFWAKGKKISNIEMQGSSFTKKSFEGGMLYYGKWVGDEVEIKVEGSIGDFVTVGSTTIDSNGEIAHKEVFVENSNEITVASESINNICININFPDYINYITGKIYNTIKAKTYFADQKGKIGGDSADTEITNGIISEPNAAKFVGETTYEKGKYCLSYSGFKIFSLQVAKNKNYHMVYPPLLPGEIRRHILMQNEWAVFYGMKPDDDAKEANFNLKSLKGFPKMYIDEYSNFPYMAYKEDSFARMVNPLPSNRITVYSYYLNETEDYRNYNPISKFQPLMIVYCAEGGDKESFESSFCEFDTTYFTNKDTINIFEDGSFSQYLLGGEDDSYKIYLPESTDSKKLTIDLMMFSGDADLVLTNIEGDANKYYLSNKVFYDLTLDKSTTSLEVIVRATTNSFYVIQYKIIDSSDTEDSRHLESGVNFITQKDLEDTKFDKKHIYLSNLKYQFEQPYLASFYSPNCKISVYLKDTKIESSIDNYVQKIIEPSESVYKNPEYDFYYKIEKADDSEYPRKFCMVYTAGIELTESGKEWNERAISLSEGVPHRYTFSDKYPNMYYAYHVSDPEKTLVLNFNLLDKTEFIITISVNNATLPSNKIYRNSQLYVNPSDFKKHCVDEEVCTVIAFVQMQNSERERKVELTMYQMDGLPFYLEKNVIKEDIVHGSFAKHYYFDIGKGEYGDITLDFKRGSGNIYARVENRTRTDPMNQPDWRGLYHFPMTNDESLKYRTYGKKILISDTDTQSCDEGCYVLISIVCNMNISKTENFENVPFRISINPRIMKTDLNVESPMVKMLVNEFVIGDIVFGLANRIYDYYTVNLPYQSEYVIFDFQADSPTLIINVGKTRPTINKAHFSLPHIGKDFVYRLNKTEILKAGGYSQDQSLRGLDLTIGIYSNVSDSIQSSPYAFKIFMPPTVDLETKVGAEIIHIRSDQKVQCLPSLIDGKYVCIFAVVFDDMDLERDMLVYPRSQNGNPITIYGNFFASEPIERNIIITISGMMDQIFLKDEYKIDSRYIFREKIDKTKSFLFVTVSDSHGDIIEVLSSTYSYENDLNLFPNPSSVQIFGIGNHAVSLNFVTTQDLLLNIVSLSGTGQFYWNDFENRRNYYLSGYDDRLSLTTFTEDLETKLAPLMVESLTEGQKEGFVFYLTFYPRSTMDQIREGRSTEIHYRNIRMPLNYYAKISPLLSWSVNFNFYDMGLENNTNLEYDSNIFKIWATIMPEDKVNLARFDPSYLPEFNKDKSIQGVFDACFGTLFFSSEDVERIYNSTSSSSAPNIFLSIEKGSNDVPEFSTMGLELSVYSDFKMGGMNPIPEGIYLNGKASKINMDRLLYLLPKDKTRPFLRVEYSTNSDKIDFILSTDTNSNQNDYFPDLKLEEVSGRKLITVKLTDKFFNSEDKLYIIILKKEANINSKLDYFVFKYLTAERESDFIEFMDKNRTKLEVDTSTSKMYKITLNPIESTDVTYYIKGVYKNGRVVGENINSIAISESTGKYMQITNPVYKHNEKISFEFDCDKELSYIKVMARVNINDKKMFYLYEPHEFEEGQQDTIKIERTDKLIQINYDLYRGSVKGTADNPLKKQKYQLVFKDQSSSNLNEIEYPDYIKVKVSQTGALYSPILYFSPTDENANENRLQLTWGNSFENEMWIKKEQFINNKLFVAVECYQESNCKYELEFSGHSSVTFESMTSYCYYVSKDNTNMIFRFRNEFESVDETLTLYATGSKDINLFLSNCYSETCEQFNFTEGSAITTPTTNEDYFVLSVTAKEGDFITVGAKVISKSGKSHGNDLTPDLGLVSGFLRKGLLEKECYKLPTEDDSYYITGTVYNSIAQITYLDEESNPIPDDIMVTRQGFFSVIYNLKETKRRFICFSFLDFSDYPKESFSYSLQLQSKNNFVEDNYDPQHTGFIYPRITPAGTLTYFYYLNPKGTESTYMVYNMITTVGYPKLYIYDCKTYPDCELDYDKLETTAGVERVAEINRMSTFDISLENIGSSPIDAHQQILVVKCNQALTEKYDHCEFMTSVFGDQEDVVLIESQPFGQYMKSNTLDHFLIDFSNQNNKAFKVQIDFLVVSGDVMFELTNAEKEGEKVDGHKYYLANKIFYSITINDTTNKGLKKIKVLIRCRIPSYYNVEYRVLQDQIDQDDNKLYSSINYLIPVFHPPNGKGYKQISIDSVPIIKPLYTIVTFYSLNCQINIIKYPDSSEAGDSDQEGQDLPSHGNYAQDFNVVNPLINLTYQHTYKIEIKNGDEQFLVSKNDICMVYVSALEIYNASSGIRKEILVSEGVPQRTLFEDNLYTMRYIYPHANPDKNITVSIHMIVAGNFRVKIFFRDDVFNHKMEYSQSTVIYVQRDWIQNLCRPDELCTMTVELEKLEAYQSSYPHVEVTIKQVLNEPYYLPRGIIKNDFIAGESYLYLYTDVGNQEGYITINFDRGSGFIYAKVVKINEENAEEGAEWRNYKFPRSKDDKGSLYYDFYNKKILFKEEDTRGCEDGCYILISVKTSVFKEEVEDSEFQDFTILADFSPLTYKNNDKVQKSIDFFPDEYVIGSFYESDDPDHNGLYEYYHIECPYNDSEGIEIDWQSDTAELYISVDTPNPTVDSHKLHYSERKDTNIYISKKELLYDEGDQPDEDFNLKYTDIYFGVYTKNYDNYDTIGSTAYSFRVHFRSKEINIYKIESDQKTICSPTKLKDNEYRCLFMIIYEKFEYFNDLIVYAKSQSPSASVDMYANYVENQIYNSFNVKKLTELIPNENSEFSTKKTKKKFIFLEMGQFLSNAYVSVISDSPEPIELYTSFKTFEDQLSPNPSSAQVYSLDILRKVLNIDFITSKSIAVRVSSLYGEAKISEGKDEQSVFYLRGAEDSFNLILPAKEGTNSMLTVENLRYGKDGADNPGFAFLIESNLRGGFNLDEIKEDETSEYIYYRNDFPVYYYSKIFKRDKDINAFFYLHNIIYNDHDKDFNRQITSGELVIKGTILEENQIYEMKKDESKKPKLEDMKLVGEYDPVMQTGHIIFPSADFKSETIKKPVLFMAIEKGDNGKEIIYNSIRGEFGLYTINGDSPITQKLYQFGKIENVNTINCFKLTADYNNNEIMRIQFAPSSKYIDLAISTEPNKKENSTELNLEYKLERGILFITFKKPANTHYLYLNVFLKEDTKDKKLNNFVFKYVNSMNKEGLFEYTIVDNNPNITLEKGEDKKIKVKFFPIDYTLKENDLETSIIYTVKLITSKPENEYLNVISMTEDEVKAKLFKHVDRNQITVEFDNVPDNYKYCQVIATITQGSIIEYVAYQAVDSNGKQVIDYMPSPNGKPNPNPDNKGGNGDGDDNTGVYVIIAVSSVLFVIVIVLVVAIVMYNSKNKDLLNQVNKISFVQSGAAGKDDANLLLDNQNELD